MTQPRPKYNPVTWDAVDPTVAAPLQSKADASEKDIAWRPMLHCPADFPIELVRAHLVGSGLVDFPLTASEQFELAISELIHHPEYNSTLILRSETISDSEADIPSVVPQLKGFVPLRTIRRKLLPRRPGRDAGLEQYCTTYASVENTEQGPAEVLVLTPIVEPGSSLPYYHPAVSHLAFRHVNTDVPRLQIEVMPLPAIPTDVSSRLYRTSLALLDTLHRYGYGIVIKYKKRVIHDRIVPRDVYQDLYLVLRERHGHLVNDWHESTDPLKHVYEVSCCRTNLTR